LHRRTPELRLQFLDGRFIKISGQSRLPSFPAAGVFSLTVGLEAPFTAVSRYRLMLDGGLRTQRSDPELTG